MERGRVDLTWGREVPAFVLDQIPGSERGLTPSVVLNIECDDFRAAVLFENWKPEFGTIEMGAYATGPQWLSRRVIRVLGDYAFNTAGVQAVIWRTSEENRRAVSIAERMGLNIVEIPRGRGRHEAEIVCTLFDNVWRQRYENTASACAA